MLLDRNPEWRDLQISFTTTTMIDALLIKMFPSFMKAYGDLLHTISRRANLCNSLVAKCFARGPKQAKDALRLLTPLLTERLSMPSIERPVCALIRILTHVILNNPFTTERFPHLAGGGSRKIPGGVRTRHAEPAYADHQLCRHPHDEYCTFFTLL